MSYFRNKIRAVNLVELIVVIVLLGILSSISLPRLFSLTSSAYASSLARLKGSLATGAAVVNAEARLQGLESRRNLAFDIDGDNITDFPIHSGHPAVANDCEIFLGGLQRWIQMDLPTTCVAGQAVGTKWRGVLAWNTFHFMPAEFDSISEDCFVSYREATSSGDDGFARGTPLDSIRVTLVTSGC